MRAASANRDASRLSDVTIFRRDAKGILLEMSFSPFTRHGKNLFTALIRDITGRKSVEQESSSIQA